MDAVPRPARLRADRQHREPVPRRLVHAVRHRSATTPGRSASAASSRRATRSSGRSSPSTRSRRNKLVEYGFDTREKLVDWLAENSLRPAREYWDNQWMQTLVRPWAVLGQEPFATHLKADPDEPVQTFRPQDISVVVVGGETRRHLQDARRLAARLDRQDRRLALELALGRLRADVVLGDPLPAELAAHRGRELRRQAGGLRRRRAGRPGRRRPRRGCARWRARRRRPPPRATPFRRRAGASCPSRGTCPRRARSRGRSRSRRRRSGAGPRAGSARSRAGRTSSRCRPASAASRPCRPART